mgnify:FL=1
MTKVYLTKTFQKELGNQRNLLKELIREIKKHAHGARNLVDLYSPGPDLKVLKAYLASKGVRSAILLRVSKSIYIPFFLAKKESKHGWNLSKHSEEILITKIFAVQKDIEQNQYQEVNLD